VELRAKPSHPASRKPEKEKAQKLSSIRLGHIGFVLQRIPFGDSKPTREEKQAYVSFV
jgi:hypothetical protein